MTDEPQNSPEDRTAPEWHLANILGYICSRPSELRDLGDDDKLWVGNVIRVGDIRAATACITRCFGSDGNEEARWLEEGESSCAACHGSGHKDDARDHEARVIAAEKVITAARELADATQLALDHDFPEGADPLSRTRAALAAYDSLTTPSAPAPQ